ncbi:MAG: molybdenum cofactor guanylyltransferase [Phycisphaeraceae bacterium]|nr:molybdenum cofactor guanylyltransferase [Phycisphaeraceae bacterium]
MAPAIQPVVLAGGRSSRFGRDKLREPIGPDEGGRWLIDVPIKALRDVFGGGVVLVGDCDPEVAARSDRVIADCYPGTGPIGGVVSALEATDLDVFVLAGDMPAVTPDVVRAILNKAGRSPTMWAVLASTDGHRPEPCFGVYRQASRAALRSRLTTGGDRSLHAALPPDRVVHVLVPERIAANINTSDDFLSWRRSARPIP